MAWLGSPRVARIYQCQNSRDLDTNKTDTGGSDRGQRNSPGLNAQPGAPARAGARHGACNASECSPRLTQVRPSSQPIVDRLLKKHCDECSTGDAWQAGHDAVIGCCVPSE